MSLDINGKVDRLELQGNENRRKLKAIAELAASHDLILKAIDSHKSAELLREFVADLSYLHARLKTTIAQLTVISELSNFLNAEDAKVRASAVFNAISDIDNVDPEWWERAANTMTLRELANHYIKGSNNG